MERKVRVGRYGGQEVRKIGRCKMMLCFESKENDFKLKTVTGSQCSWWRMAVMRCQGLVRVRTLAAEFCTYCSLLSNFAETPKRRALQ